MNNLERRAQVEELHARRAVFADAMNAERMAWFQSVKSAITERDLPASIKHEAAPSNVVAARLHWPALRPRGV